MKKSILMILGIIALFVLAACGGQQYVCADGTTVSSPDQCPAEEDQQPDTDDAVDEATDEESAPAPEPQQKEPVTQIDDAVQSLIGKAEEKITSFKFVYVGPPENLPQDTYHVKGDTIAVELGKETDFKLSQPFTHVYLDTITEEAVAYCNVKNTNWCPNGTERYGTVSFDEYYVRTPYQWLKSLKTAEHVGNGPQFESKSTAKVEFTTKDGQSGVMHIIEFNGLPGKINLDNGDTIEFRDLSTNSVKDEKVTPPEV